MADKGFSSIRISSTKRVQMIDVTPEVSKAVQGSGIPDGLCLVYVPHTTAAMTINENADPDVRDDLVLGLEHIVPEDLPYAHAEGNSTAHIKSSLVGNSVSVFVKNGRLVLGTWQGIYFCEFDGPRTRDMYIKVT